MAGEGVSGTLRAFSKNPKKSEKKFFFQKFFITHIPPEVAAQGVTGPLRNGFQNWKKKFSNPKFQKST